MSFSSNQKKGRFGMNIEKRRTTKIVERDEVRKFMMKPLLESKDLLLPEYRQENQARLYEVTMKRKKDVDSIPVHVSLFGLLNIYLNLILVIRITKFYIVQPGKCTKIVNYIFLNLFGSLMNIWILKLIKYVT